MKQTLSRRNFVQSGALIAAACAASTATSSFAEWMPAHGKSSPVRLGMASYTFRNFTRAQLIGFMKQLNLTDLNCKEVKDHLPMDPLLRLRRWPTTPLPALSFTPPGHSTSRKTMMTIFAANLNIANAQEFR